MTQKLNEIYLDFMQDVIRLLCKKMDYLVCSMQYNKSSINIVKESA